MSFEPIMWLLLLGFIIGFSSFLTVGFIYLKKRFISLLPVEKKTKKRITVLLFFMVYSSILVRPLSFFDNNQLGLLYWYAYISLGVANILVILTLFRDLVFVGSLFIEKLSHTFKNRSKVSSLPKTKSKEKLETPFLSRREFFIQTSHRSIIPLTLALSAYGIYEARKTADFSFIEVPLKNLPKEFDGFKITQITDIHVGPTIKKGYLEEIVKAVNSTKPDMVAVTGDLVDGSVENLYSHVEPLKNLKSNYGSYFVTGNHEYYSGALEWVEAIRQLGIHVLLNEHIVLKKNDSHLILAGVTDYTAHRMVPEHKTDPAKAIQDCEVNGCKILLAHQPKSIHKAAEAGYDLQISGHTHGGQIFPWNLFVHLVQPFVQGLHQYKNTWIYVNRGTGYWGIPMRLGAPSEIAEITLRSL